MRNNLRTITCLSVFLTLFSLSGYAQSEELALGKSVERELKGGEVHQYPIRLNTKQFVAIIAEQKGIDVVARLRSPDGIVVREIDSPNGSRGPELLYYISAGPGLYTIEVVSIEKEAKPGKYVITIDTLNEATADDRVFLAADSLLLEASDLGNIRDRAVQEKAIPKFREASGQYELIVDKGRRAAGFARVGDLLGKAGQKATALEYLDRAIDLYHVDGNKRGALQAMITAQNWAQSQVEYIARNDKIRLTAISLDDRRTEAFALREMALGYYNLGDFPRSIEHTRNSISIAVAIKEMGLAEGNYDNIGVLYSAQGNYASALESHQKAIDIQLATGRKSPKPGTILNIGGVYFGLGNYNLAIQTFERAKTEFQSRKIQGGTAFAISNIGSSYLEMGVYDKALEYFLEAQQLKAKFLPDDPITLYNLASVYKATGRPQEAVGNIQKAIELNQKIADNDGLTRSYMLMAEMHLDAKSPGKALEYANLAIALSREFHYTKHLWSALTAAASAQMSLGKTADARRSLDEAISQVEHLRTQLVADENSSGGFFEQKSRPYHLMISQMVAAGETENALALSERIKGRALLDSLKGDRIDITKAMTPKELEIETSLKYELASINSLKAKETDKAKLVQLHGQL
jgi:tetratricopeptide (TPR) repeat protein